MRSFMAFLALLGAALVLVAGSGCGGTEEGRTDIAKLEPPAPSVARKARQSCRRPDSDHRRNQRWPGLEGRRCARSRRALLTRTLRPQGQGDSRRLGLLA